jgi:broad specificity phosphatase PhoE
VPMPVDLVLVRHGHSERPATRHTSLWRLTEKGVAQAKRSGTWLRENFPAGFDQHYTSEYVRAMETAAWLGLPGAEWVLHPDLRERSWGDLDSLTPDQRHERFSASLAEKAVAPLYWRPPNGESMAEVAARLIGILHNLHHQCPQGRALLVCHGETIGAFRAKLEGMSQLEFAHWSTDPAERIANGEIVHYSRREPGGNEIAEHLEWRRTIVPHEPERSQPWKRVQRRRYDAEGLLAAVDEECGSG